MTHFTQLLLTATLTHFAMLIAYAETDRKTISGIVCQPEYPEDRANLKYFARGIQAVNTDVRINCPITRDSTLASLKIFEARYQRGFAPPPPNHLMNRKFTGVLFSCTNFDNGNPCNSTPEASSSASNDPTSVIFNPVQLPSGDDRHYVYKTTLPRDAILKSLIWVENVN